MAEDKTGLMILGAKMSHFGGLRSQVFRQILFSPDNKFIFTGLVERSCHLDETARAEERQLEHIIFLFEQAARRTNSLAHQDSVSIWKQGWRQVREALPFQYL